VLKVSHHGNYSATTTAFLNKGDPKYAVISVGKGNSYRHPSVSTLDRLYAKKISVYRTDKNGTIVAMSNGKTISFSTKPVPAPPAPTIKIVASVDIKTPAQYPTVNVTVTGPATGAVKILCHYKSTNTPYTVTIGSNGEAVIPV
jgi:competence protein ComEC